ncbi:MAG: lactate utilization protein [Desulfatiglans sp.]|jgi:L-lactate utilization protein LutB|nr:lactate utilization protein [Thermodesulfobacteriota bacterium]MEE4353810.1 lactate utilization protein [Desulfatiglans sp.]
MKEPIREYWKIRLIEIQKALEKNNFEAFVANDIPSAKSLVLEEILPEIGAKSIAWGGSMTFLETGLYAEIKKKTELEIFDTFDKSLSPTDALELRRRALLADLFITGTNALTEIGQLVNLDMYGNRICGITFGPRHVIILAGRNKIVPDLEQAMLRIKDYVAPANAIRLGKKTPCAQTSLCEECNSPDRICNTWTVTEKSFPKGRIKVLLINEDMGL